jgi:hypothetical protein
MSPEEHHVEADRILAQAKGLLRSSRNPLSGGPVIREAMASRARDMMAEAAVHAAFSRGVS